jgi:hypothetical protein
MNMTVSVDARHLHEAMAAAPAKVHSGLNKWVNRVALMAEREAKLDIRPHVDTGRAQSSIHVIPGYLKAEVKPNVDYALFIHEGRRPGKMPPWSRGTQLNRWATKRGMNPFLVARSIARKGIKKHPFMQQAYLTVKPTAEREASLILDEIVRSI